PTSTTPVSCPTWTGCPTRSGSSTTISRDVENPLRTGMTVLEEGAGLQLPADGDAQVLVVASGWSELGLQARGGGVEGHAAELALPVHVVGLSAKRALGLGIGAHRDHHGAVAREEDLGSG